MKRYLRFTRYRAHCQAENFEFPSNFSPLTISTVMCMYTIEDGRAAIALARKTLDRHFKAPGTKAPELSETFFQRSGVFVTLSRFPGKELRGCIGYVLPVMKLKKAIEENAVNAALRDPRFPRLRKEELEKIIVEVSLLTVPEVVEYDTPEELASQVTIGQDGLIIEKSFYKGLLLPQVPVEWGWEAEEFLDHTCMKAGLPSDAWRMDKLTVKKFSAKVFSETSPRGDVVEKELN